MIDEQKPSGLAKKLAAVMMAIDRIPKRGRNQFHKYDYALEADIVDAIRKELASRNVMLFPEVLSSTDEARGDKGTYITHATMAFMFVDGDTGETVTKRWAGAGSDKDEKGLYKAMTGGEKYFLLKTFLIPTGDDPEGTDEVGGVEKGVKVQDVRRLGESTWHAVQTSGGNYITDDSNMVAELLAAKSGGAAVVVEHEMVATANGQRKKIVAFRRRP